MKRMKKNLKESLEDYLDSLRAKWLESNPEEGSISLKELARKYHLPY